MYRRPYFLVAAALLLFTTKPRAQPDWSVTPSDFQYTMTAVGVAIFGCTESVDENDLIAAFINGEVRGVQPLDTDFQGRQYAYMIIYDNDFSGNEVSFQLYDASQDSIFETISTVGFSENGNIGNVADPFKFRTGHSLEWLYLGRDSVPEDAQAGSVVAEIFATDETQVLVTADFGFVDDSLGADNHYFSIGNNLLVLEEDVDVASKSSYHVHLSATTGDGCNLEKAVTIQVAGPDVVNFVGTAGDGNEGIALYPNPASRQLYFNTDMPIDLVRLYGPTGKMVHESKISTGQRYIDVSHLPDQLYLAVFRAGGTMTTKKLVVRH